MYKKKVLIVDDEQDFCAIVKENLELRGNFEVHAASNGRDGIRMAKKLKPDIIILDIMMPEMNGFEMLERLKKDKDTLSIPVVMLSAREDDDSKMKSAQLYNELYLTKPIKIMELQNSIEDVLRRRGID